MTTLSPTLQDALNKQAQRELVASHTYLQASFYFDVREFKGIAKYLRKESEDERTHALGIYDYILNRSGGVPSCLDVPAPQADWNSPQEVFQSILELERTYSVDINNLRTQAIEAKDHGLEIFLSAYVTEQENSVAEWETLSTKMDAYAALPGLLFHLDAELN